MNLYDDLDLLLDDLDDDVIDIVANDVIPPVKEVVHEKSENIYTMYDNSFPNRYEQGIAGSFGDIDSINAELTKTTNGVEINVTNDATGSLLDSSYLDEIIDSGKGYEFYSKPIPPRHFIEPAMENIEQTQVVENILERCLKDKGYNIN